MMGASPRFPHSVVMHGATQPHGEREIQAPGYAPGSTSASSRWSMAAEEPDRCLEEWRGAEMEAAGLDRYRDVHRCHGATNGPILVGELACGPHAFA